MYTLTPQGRWNQHQWNAKLRRVVSDVLEQTRPWSYSPAVHFGDGLFWATDRDGYGIDPDTARVSGSIKTSTAKLFFGSHMGGWALAPSSGAEDSQVFRVIDPATGQLRFDVATPAAYYTSSVARSAHGRLLAIGGGSGDKAVVTVIDMKKGQAVLNLRVSENHSVSAMAFSWKGDKLWIYSSGVGGNEFTIWDVPANLVDGTDSNNIPDQLRCGSSIECN
ncbi:MULTISPECIES: YncE family protein [Serratia]|uniref:YncE family protein n=1 Tax=Serratia TaxID=613 RepID=UPI000B6013FA|nr:MULTISPECIES: hypothetical protein [Serratia]ASM01752.1 hypothetical protein BVG88_06035 [Serratia marcescens]AYU89960.1 hypothetical protein EDY99_06245 [Serratia sp. LS-1]MBH2554007.1 hypothetical protein [Serratia ureilytica]MBH2559332.1 hypothetical protein [Serratia ureilytica]MBH2946987.1 hypothetical protein [Serratia ureilytica]